MGGLKEAFVLGLLLFGLMNSIWGVPFLSAYCLSGGRGSFYWTSLFLLGNFSAYFFVFLLFLYSGGSIVGIMPKLRHFFALLISIFSLIEGFLILLTVGTLRKGLVIFMEEYLISGWMIYLFGFLVGLYLGKSAEGASLYLDSLFPSSKGMFALASFLGCLGTFISPLYILTPFFRVFPLHTYTKGERRFWDSIAGMILMITGVVFFFLR
jgi:hypothetical protein